MVDGKVNILNNISVIPAVDLHCLDLSSAVKEMNVISSQTPTNLTDSPWLCAHALERVRLRAVRTPWVKAFKAKQPIITHCSLSE